LSWFTDEPTTKIDPRLPRVVGLQDTLMRVRALKRALPVTRVADLSPLDRASLPVFCVVTPLARDLTTHLGKGATPLAAEVSAWMEAVERIAGETVPGPTIHARLADLRGRGLDAIDPDACVLPPDTRFSPDAALDWVEGIDLTTGAAVWGPVGLVVCPSADGLLSQPDTNGLAAGNTRLEAAVHALTEVIERDAAGRVLFADLFAEPGDPRPRTRRIDPQSLPPGPAALAARMTVQGRTLLLDDLTSDIAIPVIRARLVDWAYPTADGPALRRFDGLGCDPDPELALTRALTEAAQSRLAIVQGARDSFNRAPRAERAAARRLQIDDLHRPPDIPFDVLKSAVPASRASDLRGDLDVLLAALSRAGLDQVALFDLTRPDLGLPVMRVVVPGLSRFFVDRSRVGARDLACLV
jgi:ribosomal protein S12 methylthiotransferase accessory factor